LQLFGSPRANDRDEFHFLPEAAPQQLNIPKAANISVPDPDKDFMFKQRLILVGVVENCAALPDSADHFFPPFSMTPNAHMDVGQLAFDTIAIINGHNGTYHGRY
jgi:hypothetical protein